MVHKTSTNSGKKGCKWVMALKRQNTKLWATLKVMLSHLSVCDSLKYWVRSMVHTSLFEILLDLLHLYLITDWKIKVLLFRISWYTLLQDLIYSKVVCRFNQVHHLSLLFTDRKCKQMCLPALLFHSQPYEVKENHKCRDVFPSVKIKSCFLKNSLLFCTIQNLQNTIWPLFIVWLMM